MLRTIDHIQQFKYSEPCLAILWSINCLLFDIKYFMDIQDKANILNNYREMRKACDNRDKDIWLPLGKNRRSR